MTRAIRADRWPGLIVAAGVVLASVLVAEGVAVAAGLASPPDGYRAGVVTGLPFVVGLVLGGWWLGTGDLPTERYRRVGAWFRSVCSGSCSSSSASSSRWTGRCPG